MAFDLNITATRHQKLIQLIDNNSDTLLTIHSKGALMNRWKVKHATQSLELIWGNPDNLVDNAFEAKAFHYEMNGFRSGKMSPFSCRIDAGQYHWASHAYQFNKFYLGAHAMHGLLYDAEFDIRSTAVNADHAFVELGYHYAGTDPGFPFSYDLIVQWSLFQNNLIVVKTSVHNCANRTIPIMDGWHPYFTLGGQVDDYTLKMTVEGKLEMNSEMIPSGKMLHEKSFEAGKKINMTHFDDCYLLDPMHTKVVIQYKGKSIVVQPKHNYPYLQIYTPDDRQSIAIENLSGAPNCFNNKMGLQILEPQGQIYFETSYQFFDTTN